MTSFTKNAMTPVAVAVHSEAPKVRSNLARGGVCGAPGKTPTQKARAATRRSNTRFTSPRCGYPNLNDLVQGLRKAPPLAKLFRTFGA